MMHRFVSLLAALLWLATSTATYAAGVGLPAFPQHGKPVKTDLLPIQTAAGLYTDKTTMSDVADYVLTSVKSYGAVGDGATDDTAAIQSAISSGLPIYFPPGVYKTTATLNVTAPQNDGQILRGSGSWGIPDIFNAATGYGSAVIKPTSAVTVAILIDGTPFVGGGLAQSWVQGFGIENLAIDMANMTDDASHVAIEQIQAWDGHYNQVRVRNDGTNKRAWLYKAGAFTTTMENTQGHIIEMSGNSPSYGVTTINILNHDGGRLIATNTVNVRVIGGAFQGASETKFYFRQNSASLFIATDVEGSGTFLDVDTSINDLHLDSQLQGFAGTYMNGTPGASFMDFSQQTNFNTYPFNFTWGSINLNNQGTGNSFNRSSFFSGSNAQQEYLYIGRAGGESFWGVAAASNDFVAGSAAGDTVFGPNGAGSTWILGAGAAAAKATSTGFNTFGTGTINEAVSNTGYTTATAIVLKPAANGQMLTLQNAAGNPYMICSSNVVLGSSNCGVGAGANWTGYSDTNFSALTYNFDASSGNGTFTGLVTGAGVVSNGALGVGYSPGAGGVVTQATSKSTGVTLNKTTGAITMNAAALAAATSVSFVLTDSLIAASDVIEVNIASGASTLTYQVGVEAVAAGSCTIALRNISAGSASQAVVLNFAVIKGATS